MIWRVSVATLGALTFLVSAVLFAAAAFRAVAGW